MSRRSADERVELALSTGVTLVADRWGEADRDVVLLHGGGQTRHSWGGTASSLADLGWRTWSVDMRGHGESSWDADGDYRLSSYARDLVELLNRPDGPGPKPALVGASLGGLTALWALGRLQADAARALVLVDVVPQLNVAGTDRIRDFMAENVEKGFASLEEAAESVAAYNKHRTKPPDPQGLKKNLRLRNGRWYWHWDPAFMSGPGKTKYPSEIMDVDALNESALGVEVPLMLVRGRMSDVVDEHGAQEFMRLMPHATFVDVSGAGHMIAGDRNDVFTSAVQSFLSELPA